MSNGFVSVSRKNFPNARICIDPFHVIKRLNEMVDEVRLRYQRQFQDAGDSENMKKVNGIIRLLKTKEYNQAAYWGARFNENKQRLQDAFEVAPDLLGAYEALQFFHDILASSPLLYPVRGADRMDQTVYRLRCRGDPFRRLYHPPLTGYIQNIWKHGKSNSLSEGLNNKVKVLKRIAFGLHSFESFRKRILLTCGKLRLSKAPLSVLEDARNGKGIRL